VSTKSEWHWIKERWSFQTKTQVQTRPRASDFFYCTFFSYFRSSINLEVISELGHHCVRRTRLEQIVPCGCDYNEFHPADSTSWARWWQSSAEHARSMQFHPADGIHFILLSAPQSGICLRQVLTICINLKRREKQLARNNRRKRTSGKKQSEINRDGKNSRK
jgi:hypothetical protein